MAYYNFDYNKGIVIVHGESEVHLVRFITTNLHLPIKILSKKKGGNSVQINSLIKFINKYYKSMGEFAEEYNIEYDIKKKRYKNFKIFIIMDTDDCDEQTKNKYISGEMFKGHKLAPYIVPIYWINTFEDVMMKAGIMGKRIKDKEKTWYYSKIFPINKESVSIDTLEQVRTFANKIKGIKETNLLGFIEYCFELIPNEKLWNN